MTKGTKEVWRVVVVAIAAVMAIPLAYRVYISFCPPKNDPRPSFTQYLEEAKSERAVELLATPLSKWTAADAKLEPAIHSWLKDQEKEILPWEWSEEARRKDSNGYAKCWRRVWKECESRCEEALSRHQKAHRRLEREIEVLTTVHEHRTNQVVRLRAFAATNSFPCNVALERLEKGRFWGWNRKLEVVECRDAESLLAEDGGVISKEEAAAKKEEGSILALRRKKDGEQVTALRLSTLQDRIQDCLSADMTDLTRTSLQIYQRKLSETINALSDAR